MSPERPPHPAAETPGHPSWLASVTPVVPDHELLRRIGGGSYGDVWLARTTVGTWRAVKVVFRDRFLDSRPYERELNGIQKFEPLSRSNEGFVDILQIGRNDAEGYFYYVMELADDAVTPVFQPARLAEAEPRALSESPTGKSAIQPDSYVSKTLSKVLLQRGRLPVTECLELGLTLNLGLAHLHRAGLIHRDIKPSNIIFVGGVPKLADIGLVIEVAEARSYVGTEGFIPPEGPNSPQADLYSLGKVLYEAGMGKDRKDFPEPYTQIAEAPDSAQLLEFNAILLKACAASVSERYQSAEEMNADLALLQSGGSVRRQRRLAGQLRFVQRVGALVTVLAAVIALGWWWQARQTHIVRNLAEEKARLAEEKTQLARDKTQLANENRDRLVRLDVANGVRLMDAEDYSGALVWFAEALPLVSESAPEESIHRIRIQQVLDPSPRLLQVLPHEASVSSGAFSPGGRLVATGTTMGTVRVWDAGTGQVTLALTNLGLGFVDDLRFSIDGNRLFLRSCSDQGRASFHQVGGFVAVLDTTTGEEVFPRVTDVNPSAFSPDDRWLAVARTNYVIEVLEAATGRHLVDLHGHTNEITMLSFSRDGRLLVSASRDQTVRFWRVPSGEPVGPPIHHEQSVVRAVFSPDAQWLATATEAGDAPGSCLVRTWNVAEGSEVGSAIPGSNNVFALAFDNTTGRRLILGDANNWMTVFDAKSHVPTLPPLHFEQSTARCWGFSPDGQRFVAGSDDGTACVWSLETGKALTPRLRHTGWVESVHFSPDGNRLLTTSDDGTVKIWSLKQNTEAARLALPSDLPDVPAQHHRPRGRTPGLVHMKLKDRCLTLVDPDRLAVVQELPPREDNAMIGGYFAGWTGRHWCVIRFPSDTNAPPELTLWTLDQGTFRHILLPLHMAVTDIGFNADDSRLLTLHWGKERMVQIWRTSDGALEPSVPVPESFGLTSREILFSPFDPAGRRLLVIGTAADGRGYFQLLDLGTGQLTGQPWGLGKPREPLETGSINRIRFSPDGNRVAFVAGQSGEIIDFQTGELAAPPFKHGGELLDLDWSPDGKRLITSGLAPNVKMWDAATGELLLSPMVIGTKSVVSARWSADGRFIVARNDENLVRVWDAATAEAVTPLLQHSGYVRWCCITPGNRLITASDPNLLRAWDFKPTPLPSEVITDYAKLLSGRRLNAGGVLLPIPAKELAELAKSLRARAPQLFE